MCTVVPGLGDPGGQGVGHGVPTGKGREQGGMGVQDAPGKASWMGWPSTVPNPAMATTSIGGGEHAVTASV